METQFKERWEFGWQLMNNIPWRFSLLIVLRPGLEVVVWFAFWQFTVHFTVLEALSLRPTAYFINDLHAESDD